MDRRVGPARHLPLGSASLPSVIAHLDWSARNVRLTAAALVAVYDWDSIGVARKP